MCQAQCAGDMRYIVRFADVSAHTLILNHVGEPIKSAAVAIVTHLQDEGCEARGTHLANAVAFGYALLHYCTSCRAVITVNLNDAVEQVLARLEHFFEIVIVDSGSDRRRRCAGLLLGTGLTQFHAVAIIESNALVLRNFDEIVCIGTPAVGVGPGNDAVRGHFTYEQADHGIVVCRPSLSLFVRGVAVFNHLGGVGVEGDAWNALLFAATEAEAFCIPTKYRFSPDCFDALGDGGQEIADVAIVLGRRASNGASHSEWQALHDRALAQLYAGRE